MLSRSPRTPVCIAFVAFLLMCVLGVTDSNAWCTDWSGLTEIVPEVSWDGPEFNDRYGGAVEGGYMMKREILNSEAYHEFYDIRNLDQPVLIYDSYEYSEHGLGYLSIDAAQDSVCVIRYAGDASMSVFFVRASEPHQTHRTPLKGTLSLVGHKMFQMAFSWLDGVAGIGLYDVTDIEAIVEVGFHDEGLDTTVRPFAVDDAVVLVRDANGMVEAVDFGDPVNPVVRSEVSVDVYRWLGRSGDLVFFSDNAAFYALDIGDLDSIRIAYTIPTLVRSLAVQGDLAVLSLDAGADEWLQIYDLFGPDAPVAVSAAFGDEAPESIIWVDDAVYTAGIAAYDVRDSSAPVLVGAVPTTYTWGLYVQDDFLVTAHGFYPTHCAAVSGVDDTPAAGHAMVARPNPFNPRTEISFEVGRAGTVTLDLFDSRGTHVRRLIQDVLPTGVRTATWNGRDDQGRIVSAGLYLARLVTADGTETIKVTVVK